jgi:hypothetical protein
MLGCCFGKLVQKNTNYINNAKNVCMWVQQNINSMFYYQEIGVEADGGFIGQIMPFSKGIQTSWQKEMMIEHGQQWGVIVDATFRTNEKMVIHYV